MKVNGKNYRTVWMKESSVFLIEQNLLPFDFKIYEAKSYIDTCHAISTMLVRGAGAIGAAAAFAMAQGILEAPDDKLWQFANDAKKAIEATRPTAQDLFYSTERVYNAARSSGNTKEAAISEAQKIADDNAQRCRDIGVNGNALIKDGFNVETHCNAGWLAFVDYGSAIAPIYEAHRTGKKVFVYVDETGPRCQGAKLTAWELKNEGVPHVILPDTAGAYYMSQGKVDMMIVGADRIAKNGDVANKIGTFEKAIAAKEFGIPFYVAAPSSTFDFNCETGKDIPIEERSEEEVLYQTGRTDAGKLERVLVCSPGSKAVNPAFDVTPAKYITGFITEKGVFKPNGLSRDKIQK